MTIKPLTVAILADIHGLLPALQAVVQDLAAYAPDEIIVAGDFLGGPQPLEVWSKLQSIKCRFILGNGETYMLRMRHGSAPDAWWSYRQFDMGRWVYDQLNPAVFDFLEGLLEQMVLALPGVTAVRIVHGSPWDANELVFPEKNPQDLSRAMAMIPEQVLIFAHNHLPGIYHREGKLAVNPGSVGNNLNGDPRASYATLTWNGIEWVPEIHYVAYDLDATIEVFRSTGFLEAARPLSKAFLESILTGENTALDFIQFAAERAKNAGHHDFEAVPDKIWLEAESAYPWWYDY